MFIITVTQTFAQSSQEFGKYWYDGNAEINSYKLSQGRYGELREGSAVNIFVTETFSKTTHTKSDVHDKNNIKVLKLNATKSFNTGIYPYSVMSSSFTPINKPIECLKVSTSIQEWCGHDYLELLNDDGDLIIENKSYYQGESFKDKEIAKNVLIENNIWSTIRINPNMLPVGTKKMVPNLTFLRFCHKEVQPYEATLKLNMVGDKLVYEIDYPTLNRTLVITFDDSFPYVINGWEETYLNGNGAKRKQLTTKAELVKTMKIDYWNKNTNSDLPLRAELGL